jgi:hypothetical protein
MSTIVIYVGALAGTAGWAYLAGRVWTWLGRESA